MAPARAPVDTAIALIERSAQSDWRGPDPYDGLWWRWPAWAVGGVRRRQAVVQSHARAPFDVRKLYRRRHPRIAKALGLFGSAALRAHRLNDDARALELAVAALEALAADRTAGDRAWGYPFDVQTRWSFYAAGTANGVVTSFAGTALLEAAGRLGRPDFEERAREAARWAMDELWVEPAGFFGYHPGAPVNVHNANLLVASLVHAALGEDPVARERVTRALQRTLGHQASDGSWPYGESARLGWVDSFHTGFVLRCLTGMRTVDPAVDAALARGARAYERFFDGAGRAMLWADRRYPEDAHAAGTGLSALSALAGAGHAEREIVERVINRTLSAVVRDGVAVPRRYRWGRTTAWYPRWCDAHVALGLVDAQGVLLG